MNTFVQRHRDSVIGVLNGFDRVRIRGTLRWLCYPDGLAKHLSKMRVLLKDFKGYAQQFTDRLRQGIEAVAQAAGRPIEYLPSTAISKEQRARAIAQRDGIRQGLICVLSAVEPCRSFSIRGVAQRLAQVPALLHLLAGSGMGVLPRPRADLAPADDSRVP
jgi:hypothetical protein